MDGANLTEDEAAQIGIKGINCRVYYNDAVLDRCLRRAIELAFDDSCDDATCGELRRKLEEEFSRPIVEAMLKRL